MLPERFNEGCFSKPDKYFLLGLLPNGWNPWGTNRQSCCPAKSLFEEGGNCSHLPRLMRKTLPYLY